MEINEGTFWVNLQDEEISGDINAPEDMIIIDVPAETKSFSDNADVSEQIAFATVQVNAAAETDDMGKILKEIIDALTKLAKAQGIQNPLVKFEVVKNKKTEASPRSMSKMERVSEISVNEFMNRFEQ